MQIADPFSDAGLGICENIFALRKVVADVVLYVAGLDVGTD